MISYGAALRLNLFSGKWWYTSMFTNSNIEVSHTFTTIGLIAESTLKFINDTRSKIFGNLILEMKVVASSSLILNTICNLQQLRMLFNDFFNLVLVCKDIEPRYGRTRTRGFSSTVRVVSFTTCMLSNNFFKAFIYKIFGVAIF